MADVGQPLDLVREYVQRVNERALQNMAHTGRLEGAHYAAMQVVLRETRTRRQERPVRPRAQRRRRANKRARARASPRTRAAVV